MYDGMLIHENFHPLSKTVKARKERKPDFPIYFYKRNNFQQISKIRRIEKISSCEDYKYNYFPFSFTSPYSQSFYRSTQFSPRAHS